MRKNDVDKDSQTKQVLHGYFFLKNDSTVLKNGDIFLDIDECSLSIDNCPQTSTCNNIDGSFLCNCDTKRTEDGKVCQGTYLTKIKTDA